MFIMELYGEKHTVRLANMHDTNYSLCCHIATLLDLIVEHPFCDLHYVEGNGYHSVDDIFKSIILIGYFVLFQISLK